MKILLHPGKTLVFVVVLALYACGGGGGGGDNTNFAGSCTATGIDGNKVCQDHTGLNWTPANVQPCAVVDGYSPNRCPAENRVGQCTFGEPALQLVENFYAPTDPASAKIICETFLVGVWTPG